MNKGKLLGVGLGVLSSVILFASNTYADFNYTTGGVITLDQATVDANGTTAVNATKSAVVMMIQFLPYIILMVGILMVASWIRGMFKPKG